MDYQQAGYNEYLIRPDNLPSDNQELDPLAFDQFTQDISGSKLSGLVKSQDGRVQMDLDNNSFIVSDGVVDRVRMGKLSDGSYGLLIKDKDDNTLMQIGESNFIQSPDQNSKLDFDNNNYTVSEGGIVKLLMGYQQNGF